MTIEVVCQHTDFWVVVKPAGESFHSEEGIGFVQRLQQAYPSTQFFPVHRLDKMTSGLLLFATNKEAARAFGQLFREHVMEKRYIAVSKMKPKKKQGTISGGMSASRRGQWKLTNSPENFAVTQFFSFAEGGLRFFFVRPLTGKTHQIRVALKSIGAPILGDTRYAAGAAERGYLHAFSLSFEWFGETFNFSKWPEGDAVFTDEVRQRYDELYLRSPVTWPKFKLPKLDA